MHLLKKTETMLFLILVVNCCMWLNAKKGDILIMY